MKKRAYFVVIPLLVITIFSCTGSKRSDASATSADTTQVTDMHNAENSLDYFGVYKGTTPAADCPGIEQTLTLSKDRTYHLSRIYIDRKDADFTESGTFTIDGNILTTLPKEGEPSYYKVEEGRVRMLMKDKQPVTGELEEHFVLQKQ